MGTPRERLARLEEACKVVKGLLREERTSLHGRYYQLTDAPCEPKPIGPVPLMIGGSGEKVTLRVVARHADEWNGGGSPEHLRPLCEVPHRHCEDLGREPGGNARKAGLAGVGWDDATCCARL